MKKIEAEIISIVNESDDYFSIKLKPLEEFTWLPGQFVIVRMPNSEINGKDKRTISIASTPEEGYILLGTRTGQEISNFKKELLSFKKGEKVEIQGPMGNFTKRDEKLPMILIAGGIGITPIRGLLKSLENDENVEMDLIYSSKHHIYLDLFEKLEEKNKKFNFYKAMSREEAGNKINELVAEKGNNAYYYISGTTKMAKSVQEYLLNNGIEKEHVICDMMTGY